MLSRQQHYDAIWQRSQERARKRREKWAGKPMRAYLVSVNGTEGYEATETAKSAGQAKYAAYHGLRDAGFDRNVWARLRCRSLGLFSKIETAEDKARAEAERFNAAYPVGTLVDYWSWTKEGDPSGRTTVAQPGAWVREGHKYATVALEGKCYHALTHVVPVAEPGAALAGAAQ